MANCKPRLIVQLLIVLALLSAGCASNSPTIVPLSAQPPKRPALPAEARQPKPPSICLPTCSEGVERLLSSWGASLTPPTPPAPPASAPATR